MGARGRYETVAQVVQSFVQETSWKQAVLARELGLTTRQVVSVLNELRASGMPLYSEEEPPHVVWTVPNGWFPGGVYFEKEQLPFLTDALLRLPDPQQRSRLLERLLRGRHLEEGSLSRLIEAVPVT